MEAYQRLKQPDKTLVQIHNREYDQHLLHQPAGHPKQSDALIDLYAQK